MTTAIEQFSTITNPGSDCYYSTRWLSPQQKTAVLALDGIWHALIDIPLTCRDKGIALTKLFWWQQELTRLLQNEPTHPLTQSLINAEPHYLPNLLPAITSIELLLRQSILSDRELAVFAQQTLGIFFKARAKIINKEFVDPSAEAIGITLAQGYFIQHWRAFLKNEIPVFASDPTDFSWHTTSAETKNILKHQYQIYQMHYDNAITQMSDNCFKPNLILLALNKTLLTEIAKDGFNIITQQIQLTPLRKWWIAWKVQSGLFKF